jgi:hypothetical protein
MHLLVFLKKNVQPPVHSAGIGGWVSQEVFDEAVVKNVQLLCRAANSSNTKRRNFTSSSTIQLGFTAEKSQHSEYLGQLPRRNIQSTSTWYNVLAY